MAGGGDTGNLWIKMLVGGGALVGGAHGVHAAHVGPSWLYATLLAVGGIAVVFGSCEAMIKCVEGMAERAGLNPFVAGTIAGLASNVPEIVMLGFVIVKGPRLGFIVTAFTLHVGVLGFGLYSALIPRDETGHATLPAPLVKLSTDLYACAGAACLTIGGLMLMLREFGHSSAPALSARDLYVIGGLLLMVQVVAIVRLVKRFSGADAPQPESATETSTEGGAAEKDNAAKKADAKDEDDAKDQADSKDEDKDKAEEKTAPPSVGAIVAYGLIGVVTSVVGGHAVGDFADILVKALSKAGYSQMFGALLLAVFACAGAVAMIATAHVKKMYDIALANVSGWINQMPFVVMPITLIMMAAFAQTGVIPMAGAGVLPIDLQTTSVFFLAFPPLLLLWKSIQDDGRINWVETATMIAVFVLAIYFLAELD